jgi:dihydropyrimidinase
MSEFYDCLVKGGVLVSSNGLVRSDVLISKGKVNKVGLFGDELKIKNIINAKGAFILPGIIDAHIHPVYADRIKDLSRAAALSGVTTVIPYIGSVKAWGKTGGISRAVGDFIVEGERDSCLDFAIHCALMSDDMATLDQEVKKAVQKGVVSFKAFTAYSKRGMKLEDEEILKCMEVVAQNKGLFAVHAENGAIIDHLEKRFLENGQTSPEFFPQSHPNLSEAEAVFRILSLASVSDCPVYLAHLSCAESLEVVRLFKKWGKVKFYCETCPHYLTLTDENMEKWGSLAKMSPPLRKSTDIEALWQAVAEGLIDVVASDAAGHALSAKQPQFEDIFSHPNGIPGLESLFCLTLQKGVNQGRITLPALVRLLCENPARIFGIYPQKGNLLPGADADITILDPAIQGKVPEGDPNLKVGYSLYQGFEYLGAPRVVMQRGRVMVKDGEFLGEAGLGAYLPGYLA